MKNNDFGLDSHQKPQTYRCSGFRNQVFSRDVLPILIKSEVFSRDVLRIQKNGPKNEEEDQKNDKTRSTEDIKSSKTH